MQKIPQLLSPDSPVLSFFCRFNTACYLCASSLSNNLSRKAEGNGPMMPWQPISLTQRYEGANSDHESGKISQSNSLIPEATLSPYIFQAHLTYR